MYLDFNKSKLCMKAIIFNCCYWGVTCNNIQALIYVYMNTLNVSQHKLTQNVNWCEKFSLHYQQNYYFIKMLRILWFMKNIFLLHRA